MTVRDATRRESPDGHVLYIEDLRRHLGIGTLAGASSSSATTPSARPEVILIGHDMHDDFRNLERDGIDLRTAFNYSGCLDTAVIIEDTATYTGKSLSGLVSHYDLANLEYKKPGCPKLPGKYTFIGSHCAGNDAIKTLEASLAQTLDLGIKTPRDKIPHEPTPPDDWLSQPLNAMNTNLILLAYDIETVETPRYKPQVPNRTSEHGFAWLRLADIVNIAPGLNACNWRPFIRARHYINQDFHNFKNWFYCVGNPLGFWPEYGESQYYRVREGPAVFHEMFKEIATFGVEAGEASGGVPELLEEETGNAADEQDDLVAVRGNHGLSRDIPLRGRGLVRGNPNRGNEGRRDDGGGSRDNRGGSWRGRGDYRGRSRGGGRGGYNRGGRWVRE